MIAVHNTVVPIEMNIVYLDSVNILSLVNTGDDEMVDARMNPNSIAKTHISTCDA